MNNDKQQRCLDYIHQNPVKVGIITEPEHYVYSSPLDYAGEKGILPIKLME